MKVQVEQRHIDAGVPYRPFLCPVSLALTSATHGLWGVNWQSAMRGDGEVVEEVKLPKEAQHFVQNFDIGLHVEPFEFEFDWPPK